MLSITKRFLYIGYVGIYIGITRESRKEALKIFDHCVIEELSFKGIKTLSIFHFSLKSVKYQSAQFSGLPPNIYHDGKGKRNKQFFRNLWHDYHGKEVFRTLLDTLQKLGEIREKRIL